MSQMVFMLKIFNVSIDCRAQPSTKLEIGQQSKNCCLQNWPYYYSVEIYICLISSLNVGLHGPCGDVLLAEGAGAVGDKGLGKACWVEDVPTPGQHESYLTMNMTVDMCQWTVDRQRTGDRTGDRGQVTEDR